MKFASHQSGLTILPRFDNLKTEMFTNLATDHRGQPVQFDLPLERYEN